MNKRIKELEAQCWVQIPCDFDMTSDGLSTIRTVFDREKFAELIIKEYSELIIKECSELIQLTLDRSICPMFTDEAYERGYLDGRNDAASMIMDIFGIN